MLWLFVLLSLLMGILAATLGGILSLVLYGMSAAGVGFFFDMYLERR